MRASQRQVMPADDPKLGWSKCWYCFGGCRDADDVGVEVSGLVIKGNQMMYRNPPMQTAMREIAKLLRPPNQGLKLMRRCRPCGS